MLVYQKTLFQPQQSKDSKIHILGLLEGMGLSFDATWVIGLTHDKLPAAVKLSPFIPHSLQRKLNMPHACNQREYEFAEKSLSRLRLSSDEVHFSYYGKDGDQIYQPSPLLQSIPNHEQKIIGSIDNSHALESVPCRYHLPIPAQKIHKGHASLLKEQALCPFRAYAKYHLNIEVITPITQGLDDKNRGILVHRALECFWREIKTQQTLNSLSEDALEEQLNKHIQQAIKALVHRHPVLTNLSYQRLEHTRLFELLWRWLQLEKTLPEFEVEALEKEQSLQLNRLQLNLRLDRIDKLVDTNEMLIIDYKTGSPSISHWFEDRIEEPQLPLYALSENKTTALAFFQVKANDLKIKGVSASSIEHNSFKEISSYNQLDWQKQKKSWQQSLSKLADEFTNGYIEAKPKNNSLCQTCEFKGLCRINELDD
jgi:probable DNA repair protein